MKFEEQISEKAVDDVGGCRKGKNMVKDKTRKSGGLITFMSCIGFILDLSPVLRTESPTLIFQKLINLLFNDENVGNYFSRCVVVWGWDMMCNMMKRLFGEKMREYLWSGLDDPDNFDKEVIKIYYIHIAFGLHRLFIDAYHSKFHTQDECCKSCGWFNVHHERFKSIFTQKNHNIAEQLWVSINKLKNFKKLGSEKYDISIYLAKELHNHNLKRKLESQGISFESVLNWEPKLKIRWEEAQKWYENMSNFVLQHKHLFDNKNNMYNRNNMYNKNNIKCWIPNGYDDLIKSQNNHKHFEEIVAIQRQYVGKPMPKYINFWADKGEKFKPNTELNLLIKYLNAMLNSTKMAEAYTYMLKSKGNKHRFNLDIKKLIKQDIKKQIKLCLCKDNEIIKKRFERFENIINNSYVNSKCEDIYGEIIIN